MSPVRHWLWTRTSTGSSGSMSPITSARCSSPVDVGAVGVQREVAVERRQPRRGDALDQRLVLQPVADQVGRP